MNFRAEIDVMPLKELLDPQGKAVEHVRKPERRARKLEAFYTDGQHVDRDQGSPDVEASWLNLCGAEENTGEGGEKICGADTGVAGSNLGADQDPC